MLKKEVCKECWIPHEKYSEPKAGVFKDEDFDLKWDEKKKVRCPIMGGYDHKQRIANVEKKPPKYCKFKDKHLGIEKPEEIKEPEVKEEVKIIQQPTMDDLLEATQEKKEYYEPENIQISVVSGVFDFDTAIKPVEVDKPKEIPAIPPIPEILPQANVVVSEDDETKDIDLNKPTFDFDQI